MRMSEFSYQQMNLLTSLCFDANAVFDNLAYSLEYHYYSRIAKIVHLKVAHKMPEWADKVTDEMLMLSARPVRKDIKGYEQDYEDVKEIFEVLKGTLEKMRGTTKQLIEIADINGDDEVKLFAEDFLMEIQPYIKQSEEWIDASQKLDANKLNIHIDDYTHFISL